MSLDINDGKIIYTLNKLKIVKTKYQSVNSPSKNIIIFILLVGMSSSSCSKLIDNSFNPLVGHNWVVYIDGYVDNCLLRFNTNSSTLRCGSDIGTYNNNNNVIINFPWKAPYFQGGIETFKCNCAGYLETNTDPLTQPVQGPSGTNYKSDYLIKGEIETLKSDGSIDAAVAKFVAYRIE